MRRAAPSCAIDIAPVRAARRPAGDDHAPRRPVASARRTATPASSARCVPLGGKKEARVAEAAIAASGSRPARPTGKGVAAIETRKAVDQRGRGAAVDELAARNVVAIIGPIEGASVDAAGRARRAITSCR